MIPDRARCGVARHAERATRSPKDRGDMADLRPVRAQSARATLGQDVPLVKRDYATLRPLSVLGRRVGHPKSNEAGGDSYPRPPRCVALRWLVVVVQSELERG